MSSFDEFVMERCEEIITKDELCLIASIKTREASKAFFNSLSPGQQKEYLKFESINEQRNSCCSTAIYKQAFRDGRTQF